MDENITYTAYHECWDMRHMRGWMDISVSFQTTPLSWNLDKLWISYNQNTSFDVFNIMDENITYAAYHECWEMRHMRGWMDISVSFQTTHWLLNLGNKWVSCNKNTLFKMLNVRNKHITYDTFWRELEMEHMRFGMNISAIHLSDATLIMECG